MIVEENVGQSSLDLYNARRGLSHLDSMLNSKPHNKKRRVLKKELESFLLAHSKSLSSAIPEDIRLFLVLRDINGKTQPHSYNCPFLGEKSKVCSCPFRLAFGTVASLISQLKAIFDDHGRVGEWTECGLFKYGNPVFGNIVSNYLEAVKLEQAKAHVPVRQAKPLF